MSFRIDLRTKDGVPIYLLVVNDQITLNFDRSDSSLIKKADSLGARFVQLIRHGKLFELLHSFVRGANPEHLKRHHGTEDDLNTTHYHFRFDEDVNPELLEQFLTHVLSAQEASSDAKNVFITAAEADAILDNFTIFYTDFKGSPIEKESLQERRLTTEEKESLFKHAKADRNGILSKRDLEELEQAGFPIAELSQPAVLDSDTLNELGGILPHILLLSSMIDNLSKIKSLEHLKSESVDNHSAVDQDDTATFSGLKAGFLNTSLNSNPTAVVVKPSVKPEFNPESVVAKANSGQTEAAPFAGLKAGFLNSSAKLSDLAAVVKPTAPKVESNIENVLPGLKAGFFNTNPDPTPVSAIDIQRTSLKRP